MKTAVIYYTFDGNSEAAAKKLSQLLSADLFRIHCDTEPPHTGLGKFLVGGKMALSHETPVITMPAIHFPDYGRIVIVGPVWAGTYSPAIGSFLRNFHFTGKNVYLIACSASGRGDAMLEQMKEKLDGNQVLGTLNLKNPGRNRAELRKVVDFCRNTIL